MRRRDLLDPSRLHDRDAIRHGQRFDLVVSDDDRWLVQCGKDFLDLCSHRLTQLDVETTQGFVEQKARRVANNGSPDRNPLLFTLAELMGTALQDRREVESLADPGDALGDLRLAQLFGMQWIGEVLVD